MSMLFNKKTRNVIKGVWFVVAALVMFSMIVAYSGGVGFF
jgi:hypothetical protein